MHNKVMCLPYNYHLPYIRNTNGSWGTDVSNIWINILRNRKNCDAGSIDVEKMKHRDSVHCISRQTCHKNIERHTADTIVSLPNSKQWIIVHTSELIMIIRQSVYIISIITREMGKLETYSPIYCIMDNGENMLNLTHTLDKIYLTGI